MIIWGDARVWLKGADCNSAGVAYRGSNPLPPTLRAVGIGILIAEVTQLVEYVHGKDEVGGSNPLLGSDYRVWQCSPGVYLLGH